MGTPPIVGKRRLSYECMFSQYRFRSGSSEFVVSKQANTSEAVSDEEILLEGLGDRDSRWSEEIRDVQLSFRQILCT